MPACDAPTCPASPCIQYYQTAEINKNLDDLSPIGDLTAKSMGDKVYLFELEHPCPLKPTTGWNVNTRDLEENFVT